jgi:hypothetical protein
MFIPILVPNNNGFVQEALLLVSQIKQGFTQQGKFFVHDGELTYETPYSLELIEAMACPVIPAQDGYAKLFYSFNVKLEFPAHPVLAWRVRTPYALEPISLFDDQFSPPGLTAIRYPDGRVLVLDSELEQPVLADTDIWHDYVAQERLIWLKNAESIA